MRLFSNQCVGGNTMIQFKAYFYELKNAQESNCRLYLEIRQDNLVQTGPDLILVMLNPGSCKSEQMKYNEEIEVTPDQTLHRVKSLIKTIPGLNWIRVLNLSDLINPKNNDFFKNLKEIEKTADQHHSIFDDSRFEVLKQYIRARDKVYLACGIHPDSSELVAKAKSKIRSIGASILNKSDKYYHPLVRPNKKDIIDWRDQISKVLQST